jgi:Fe-S oxidoreductase
MKENGNFKGKKITYHDSCYLGRANGIYEAPRKVLEALDAELIEMKRCRSKGLCCGAGGAQMFKEEEKGTTRVNWERTDEALETGAGIIASACPFCNTMMTDGVKTREKEENVQVLDIAELIAASLS